MFRRIVLLVFVSLSTTVWEAPTAEAGWRNNRRMSRNRTYNRQSRTRYRNTRSSSQNKPHMTQSRSAVLDGFFGPGPGVQGHDRSWYVGR